MTFTYQIPAPSIDEVEKAIEMLKRQGVSKFKGLGIEVELDPHAGLPASQLPRTLFEDEELVDAADGEKAAAFKRAQEEHKKNLEWSMG